jgi:MoaA/NifB/PqqE/SkfB family radical SAM enzyme
LSHEQLERRRQFPALCRFLAHLALTWPQFRRTSPHKLIFFVTERCDSHCQTCGVWTLESDGSNELNSDQILRIVQSLSSDLYWVTVTGGEPTMRDDFPEIIRGIANSCPKLTLLNFHTNGFHSERVLKNVRAVADVPVPYLLVSVSIDGIGALHDVARGTPGAFENLERTIRGLLELEQKWPHFHLSFETVATAINRHALREIHRFIVQQYGPHTHVYTLADDSDLIGHGPASHVRSGPDDVTYLKEAAKEFRLRRIVDLLPLSFIGLATDHFSSRGSVVPCSAVRDVLTVDAKGVARYCYFHNTALGSLADFGWNAKALLADPRTAQATVELSSCRRCYTPCMAFSSLLRSPLLVLKGLRRAIGWRLFHRAQTH